MPEFSRQMLGDGLRRFEYVHRRSGETPMLYVSGGFVFSGAGAVCEGLIYHVFGTTIVSAALAQAVIVSSGMILVRLSLTK
ncbi:DUF7521 family protein [Haloterrigena gelatinilytica]|uniref:DUF7521 family protein n=1 Tax=Haloterrigena gelatinilytica TaxID=2741724 RepID=UPI0020C5B7B9|nr:hypothetical protein [Haloterrigena gelatinilytica]